MHPRFWENPGKYGKLPAYEIFNYRAGLRNQELTR